MTESKAGAQGPTSHTITPHIVVRDAVRAATWYATVFGAEERGRIEVPGGKLMQIELSFGDTRVMLADEFPEFGVVSPLSIGGTATVLHYSSAEADAVWERAIEGGAEVHQPLHDAFWGERYGQIVDPFGHRWGIAQRLREVPHEEVARAAADAFGG
jgi:PhnB protein